MRISDWSSDVCSSDLVGIFGDGPLECCNGLRHVACEVALERQAIEVQSAQVVVVGPGIGGGHLGNGRDFWRGEPGLQRSRDPARDLAFRSEEHTSELQSLMRISYAVFCLKKKNT